MDLTREVNFFKIRDFLAERINFLNFALFRYLVLNTNNLKAGS